MSDSTFALLIRERVVGLVLILLHIVVRVAERQRVVTVRLRRIVERSNEVGKIRVVPFESQRKQIAEKEGLGGVKMTYKESTYGVKRLFGCENEAQEPSRGVR